MTTWADDLTTIALRWKTGRMSIRDLFAHAAPPQDIDEQGFMDAVRDRLIERPELREAWQSYSYDKRSSPSPFLDGLEVGFHDATTQDVRMHSTAAEACADFIYREIQWVLHRRRA